MEKSRARERLRRDLSAPWLRHSGRDDGGVGRTPVEMTVVGLDPAVQLIQFFLPGFL